MKESTIISWIFLAIEMASKQAPASYSSIEKLADAINHAIPMQKEMQFSINWLLKNELIIKSGAKYVLSKYGMEKFALLNVSNEKNIFELWKAIESDFELKYNLK